MSVLPVQPNIDHLRRQARDLVRAARAGDAAASERLQAVAAPLTLAGAQLTLAREYGFASWATLKADVEVRSSELGRITEQFCRASINDWTGRAARMLEAHPDVASYSFFAAVVLGEAVIVRQALTADQGLATRPDTATGFSPLHVACASRWHRLDAARADGLYAVARMLLEAGADAEIRARAGGEGGWSPLRCAVAGEANPEIAELLLDHGAVPDDHDLYLAGFADDDHRCVELLLAHARCVREIARMALAAPISGNDLTGVRLLLEAGADPGRYLSDDDDDDGPTSVVRAAVRSGCAADLVELLLVHGAEPDLPGSDGRSPYALAVSLGRTDLAAVLLRYGARDDASGADRLLQSCLLADANGAASQLALEPGLLNGLAEPEQAATLIQAAEAGNAAAVRLMLDLGFAINARDAGDGGTALHAAAFAGSADVIRLLLERGADLAALDSRWDSPPVVWAVIGSGARPGSNPGADWVASVKALIDAGADVSDVTLSPDDPKPPSPEVTELLIAHGVSPG